ncbi:MAG: hypothetical protein JOS17DRAFT_53851 [Linnemannia elongata]|nr:MAG: hypothetical protein JOS17DRAFT_53851 [Linnemannia elongata]
MPPPTFRAVYIRQLELLLVAIILIAAAATCARIDPSPLFPSPMEYLGCWRRRLRPHNSALMISPRCLLYNIMDIIQKRAQGHLFDSATFFTRVVHNMALARHYLLFFFFVLQFCQL